MSIPVDTSIYVGSDKAFVPFDTTSWVTWNPETFELGEELGAPSGSRSCGARTTSSPCGRATRTSSAEDALSALLLGRRGLSRLHRGVRDQRDRRRERPREVGVARRHARTSTSVRRTRRATSTSRTARAASPLRSHRGHPKNCFFRVNAGGGDSRRGLRHLLPATSPTAEEGSNVFVIDDDLALFNVYRRARRARCGRGVRRRRLLESYHLWTLDLETYEAKPMEGIDYSGCQFVAYRIDGQRPPHDPCSRLLGDRGLRGLERRTSGEALRRRRLGLQALSGAEPPCGAGSCGCTASWAWSCGLPVHHRAHRRGDLVGPRDLRMAEPRAVRGQERERPGAPGLSSPTRSSAAILRGDRQLACAAVDRALGHTTLFLGRSLGSIQLRGRASSLDFNPGSRRSGDGRGAGAAQVGRAVAHAPELHAVPLQAALLALHIPNASARSKSGVIFVRRPGDRVVP